MPTVQRTVSFYKLVPIVRREPAPGRQEVYDLVSEIDPNDDDYFYEHIDGEKLCIFNDTELDSNHSFENVRFAMGKVRSKNLPGTLSGGTRKLLIANNVLEQTHVVLFNGRILGAEWNQYGPRTISDFPRYLREIFPDRFNAFTVKPLFDSNIIEVLNRFSSLTMMSIQLDKEKAGLLRAGGASISDAIDRISQNYPIATIQVEIKMPRPDSSSSSESRAQQRELIESNADAFSHRLFQDIEALANNESAVGAMKRFEVHGIDSRTGRAATINLLESRINTKVRVENIDDRHGVVDSESMYDAIIKAHEDLSEDINNAVVAG